MFYLGSHRTRAVIFVIAVLVATAAKTVPTALASLVRRAYRLATED